MTVRFIADDGVTASFGLAADEVLAHRVGEGTSPPTLRLYTYRSHAALVGRFQSVSQELNLPFCEARGIAVNRRPTGGGAILMGDQQLGVALAMAAGPDDTYGQARESMERFGGGVLAGLSHLGVSAAFRRKNDIEVDGRKLVGLGMYKSPSGGLLLHASILVDLDVPLMLDTLRTPYEKLEDKGLSSVASRVTTLRRILGADLSVEQTRAAMARGYARILEAELASGEFSTDEQAAIRSLEETKYRSSDWLFQESGVGDGYGSARVKTPTGLFEAKVALAGQFFKAVHIEGDFFASETALSRFEASLRWRPAERSVVREALIGVSAEEIAAADRESLTEVVLKAAAAATQPYGCFVGATKP